MSYWIACTLLLFLALASRHAAQESATSGDDGSDLEKGSPQYVYMQQLHAELMESKERTTASVTANHGGGTLLATSFESQKSSCK